MFRYIAFHWRDAHPEQSEVARQLEHALRAQGIWQPALGIAGCRVYTTGAVRGVNDIHLLPLDQGVIVGRLFRRNPAAAEATGDFELAQAEARRIVQSHGRDLVKSFWGRYVAFLSPRTEAPRVLRDPTGSLPCYRIEVGGVSIVLSWLEDLITLLNVPMPAVNWDAIAAHLLFGRLGGRETALQGVTQLLPGELTAMSSEDGMPQALWSAVDLARAPLMASPDDAQDQLRETTIHCVQSWASCYGSIVLRLSGGVDSSILLGSLRAGIPARRITCLNYFSPGSDSDERRYARLAAQRAGTPLVERHRNGDVALEEVLDVARTPIPSNYLGSLGSRGADFEVAAARQAHAVFTGAGGDQLFFEFQCTWPAADYLKLQGWDRHFFKAALYAAHLGRVSYWEAIRRALADRAFKGHPAEGTGRSLALMHGDAKGSALQTARRFIHAGWLDAADLPIGKFHQVGALISSLEYYDPYVKTSIERIHPLLSQPLLELCLATPTYTLTHGGRGRALARRAFAKELPPEIATRRSKGGIEQHVTEVLRRNLPFAREMLLDGQLAHHGLLDRGAVEAALSGRPSTAAYISEIHTCIAVETWIRRITGCPRAASR